MDIRIKCQSLLAEQEAPGFHAAGEVDKGLLHGIGRPVDIEVIGIHGCYDGDIGAELEEAAVVLIGLHDAYIPPVAPEIAVVVNGNPAQEGIAAIAAVPEDMSDHRRDGGLAVGTGNTNIKRAVGYRPQDIAALEEGGIVG